MHAQSDLARECGCESSAEGVRVTSCEAEGYEILRVRIKSEEAAKRIGKPCGRYVTVACAGMEALEEYEKARRVLAVEIREMAERMTGKRIDSDFSLLVVGVGNAMGMHIAVIVLVVVMLVVMMMVCHGAPPFLIFRYYTPLFSPLQAPTGDRIVLTVFTSSAIMVN